MCVCVCVCVSIYLSIYILSLNAHTHTHTGQNYQEIMKSLLVSRTNDIVTFLFVTRDF